MSNADGLEAVNYAATDDSNGFRLYVNSSVLEDDEIVFLYTGATSAETLLVSAPVTSTDPDGWIHVAADVLLSVPKGPGTARLWINGIAVDTDTQPPSFADIAPAATSLILGAH